MFVELTKAVLPKVEGNADLSSSIPNFLVPVAWCHCNGEQPTLTHNRTDACHASFSTCGKKESVTVVIDTNN